MATATKTARVEIAGRVIKAELKQYPARDSGRYGSERWDVKVLVGIETDDGRQFWFYTPATDSWVSSSGPYSVAGVIESDWVTYQKWDCEGFAGARGLGRTPISRVKVGDRVTVSGKVKGTDRFGVQLWYVRRHDYSHAALVAAYRARAAAAMARVPATHPGDSTPPAIPGVEWVRYGGYPALCDPDSKSRWYPSDKGEGHAWLDYGSKITNARDVIAWAEGIDPAAVEVFED